MANVIIAGGATRIGRASVRGFRARGRQRGAGRSSAAGGGSGDGAGAGCDPVHPARSLEPNAPAEVVNAAINEFGSLDSVLITAALMLSAPLSDWTQDMWDRSVALNLRMPFFFAQAAAPHLAKSDNASLIFHLVYGCDSRACGDVGLSGDEGGAAGLGPQPDCGVGAAGHSREHDPAGLDRYAVQRSVLGSFRRVRRSGGCRSISRSRCVAMGSLTKFHR